MAPEVWMVQIEIKCIFNIGKKIYILSNVSQVSDVALGPLVFIVFCYLAKASFLQDMLLGMYVCLFVCFVILQKLALCKICYSVFFFFM
jgi:hypothetical protein